jgi:hypothetical protein
MYLIYYFLNVSFHHTIKEGMFNPQMGPLCFFDILLSTHKFSEHHVNTFTAVRPKISYECALGIGF